METLKPLMPLQLIPESLPAALFSAIRFVLPAAGLEESVGTALIDCNAPQ